MKRSHAIALGATGVILAGAWLGSGNTRVGDEDAPTVEAGIYADANECISARVLTRDVCEAEFKKATEAHVASAPKYADRATCETQYGANQCRTSTFNGASVFVPAMIGMLVANHLSGQRQSQPLYPNRNAPPACAPGQTPQTQPGCTTSSSRSYATSTGSYLSRSIGQSGSNTATRIPAAVAAVPVARSTVIPAGTPYSAPTASPASSGGVARGGFGSTGHASSSSS